MSGRFHWEKCPWCGKVRRTTYSGRVFMPHRMWDPAKKKMILCPGSGGQAGKNKASAWKKRT
jgi:hypothetical protein